MTVTMPLQDQHELDVHISSSPGLLQRVLGTCAEPIQSLHQLMLLTMHAVLLETGMQLTHQVLPMQNPACLRSLAENWRMCGRADCNKLSIQFTNKRQCIRLLCIGFHMCIALWHCVLQEDKYALPKDALSRCSSACQLQYRLQQQQGHPVYEVKYIGLGAGMACIAATSDGSRVTTLNVSLQQHLQQQLMQIGMMCMP